jgi:hypothetical protein
VVSKRTPKCKTEGGKGAEDCRRLGEFLRGRVLSIDPSSGSAQSKPGYAFFVGGQLMCSGIFNEVSSNVPFFKKMRAIAEHMEQFGEVDCLLVENIAPFMSAGGSGFRTGGVTNLHKSIGAVMAGANAKTCIEVQPMAWHSFVNKRPWLFEGYKEYPKSDEHDAITIGLFALHHGGMWSEEQMKVNFTGILNK